MAESWDHFAAASSPALAQNPPRLVRLGVGTGLIILYLAITRVGGLEAAKLGVQLGPVPLFLTDIFVILLTLCVVFTRPALVVMWLVLGGACGFAGRMVWVLVGTCTLYAITAYPQWHIFAIRDFAIFAYALIFPMAYFAMDSAEKAAAVIRAMTYAGAALAALLIIDSMFGLHIWFEASERFVTEERTRVTGYGTGDTGGLIAFALVALLAFVITDRRHRLLHGVMLWLCAIGVAIPQTRAAFFGVAMAVLYSLFCMGALARIAFMAGAVVSALLAVFIVVYLPESGLAHVISGYVEAIIGGAGLSADDNFYFRLLRWNAVAQIWLNNPIFGVGFGIPLIPDYLIQEGETGLNAGLPHNSFLTTLARLGFFGLALVLLPWLWSMWRATRSFRRSLYPAETLATAMMLICMLGYANFVLFLERPMHAAALWIVAAAACRLAVEA